MIESGILHTSDLVTQNPAKRWGVLVARQEKIESRHSWIEE
jgi:hypothetical protein